MYYKIRKEWNGGKWTPDQKGAYSSKEAAIENCSQELIDAGYKVFSPEGDMVYPYHEVARMLYEDGITCDPELWSTSLFNNVPVSADLFNTIVKLYHDKLHNNSKDDVEIDSVKTIYHNDIMMLKIPVNKFKISYLDAPKRNMSKYDIAFNLGYFGGYKEDGVYFTLPSANLVCDIDTTKVSPIALKYLQERKIKNGKLYFSANKNSTSQFRSREVSTLVIKKDGTVEIKKLNSVEDENIVYAVSGAPIVVNGSNYTNYRVEGWDSSIGRSTYHSFLGVKGNDIYYFYMNTTTSDCITSSEAYSKIKDFGFDNVIKLDGGGSFYFKSENEGQQTSENRHINSIGIVSLD